MLTETQRAAYEQEGLLRLPRTVSPTACAALQDELWRILEKVHGIRCNAPQTWQIEMPRGLGRYMDPKVWEDVGTPELIAVIDELLGAGTWDRPKIWAQPLPLFPASGPWDVPSRMWHLDYPVRGAPRAFAVKLLCLLAPVEPRGGGTLLLAGSHRLMAQYAERGVQGGSTAMRKHLCGDHDWFRTLMSDDRSGVNRVQRFMAEGTVIDDVPLKIVEFTGSAGDVMLFHPWLLHNVSPNRRTSPRLMVGQNVTTRQGLEIYIRPQPRLRPESNG